MNLKTPTVLVAVAMTIFSLALASCRNLRSLDQSKHVQTVLSFTSVSGYLPFWNHDQALQTLQEHPNIFSEISPFWYQLDASGNVSLFEDGWYYRQSRIESLRAMGAYIVPVIANHNDTGWDAATVSRIINNSARMNRHINDIVKLVVSNNYDGIDIDYENLYSRDRDAFSRFIRMLAGALHDKGKTLSVSVYAKLSEPSTGSARTYHYAALGRAADQVRIMAYNYHWTDSSPGPIAPAWWVESVTEFATDQISREKVVLGFGLYGIDWLEEQGREITWERVQSLISTSEARARWDAESMSPWFRYTDSSSRERVVWFENAQSIKHKLDVAKRYGVTSVQFWHLGGEDPKTWQVVRNYVNGEAASAP